MENENKTRTREREADSFRFYSDKLGISVGKAQVLGKPQLREMLADKEKGVDISERIHAILNIEPEQYSINHEINDMDVPSIIEEVRNLNLKTMITFAKYCNDYANGTLEKSEKDPARAQFALKFLKAFLPPQRKSSKKTLKELPNKIEPLKELPA